MPRIAAAQAKRVASMPSFFEAGDESATACRAVQGAQFGGQASTGSSSSSCTLASSSTVSYGLPPVTAHTSRQNGASAASPTAWRGSVRRWRRESAR